MILIYELILTCCYTGHVRVGEIEFLRAELIAKNKVLESLLLPQSILCTELICSYKSDSRKLFAGDLSHNRYFWEYDIWIICNFYYQKC